MSIEIQLKDRVPARWKKKNTERGTCILVEALNFQTIETTKGECDDVFQSEIQILRNFSVSKTFLRRKSYNYKSLSVS